MSCSFMLIPLPSHILQLTQQLLPQHILQLPTLPCFFLSAMTQCELTLQLFCFIAALLMLDLQCCGNTLLLPHALL